MKHVLLLALAVLISTSAFAAKKLNFYTIDMTGKRFGNDTFNLMNDDMGNYDGVQIQLAGKLGEDFEISATHSERHDENCKIGKARMVSGFSIVKIQASVETDSGETCDYKITYQDGRTAVLSVYEEGT